LFQFADGRLPWLAGTSLTGHTAASSTPARPAPTRIRNDGWKAREAT